MLASQEIKGLFLQLPEHVPSGLLEGLLPEQELQGKVLIGAETAVSEKRKKKPCPDCHSEQVYRRGQQQGVPMYFVKLVRTGIVKP